MAEVVGSHLERLVRAERNLPMIEPTSFSLDRDRLLDMLEPVQWGSCELYIAGFHFTTCTFSLSLVQMTAQTYTMQISRVYAFVVPGFHLLSALTLLWPIIIPCICRESAESLRIYTLLPMLCTSMRLWLISPMSPVPKSSDLGEI